MKKSETVFLISLILLASIYYIASLIQSIGLEYSYEDSINLGEYKISLEVLVPEGERVGTIVLIHGILSSRKMLKPLATDLVRVGWRVILVDQIGHGESGGMYRLKFDDLSNLGYALKKLVNQTEDFRRALISYLKDHTEENEKVVFGGHSLGGLLSLILARESEGILNILATIGIAPPYIENVTNASSPRNMLLCVGKYDEFIPVDDLRKFVNPEYPEIVEVGKITGDFKEGTARKIFLSQYSDHIFEPYDPTIISEIIRWLDLCLGYTPRNPVILSTPMAALKALCALIGLILVAMMPIVFADKLGMLSGGKRFPTIKLLKNSLVASMVIWPFLTLIFLAMFIWPMVSLAGYLGYVMPVLVGGYILVATLAILISSNYLAGGDIKKTLRKIYIYAKSDLMRSLFLGALEAIVFLVVLDITLGDVLIPMIPRTLGRIVIMIPLAMMIFGYFIFHEYFYRAQIQEILGGKRRRAAILSIGVSLGSKMVVIAAITALIYFISPAPAVATAGLVGMLLVAFLTEGLAATSYYATREILPHAFASAILWASIAASAFPVIHITA